MLFTCWEVRIVKNCDRGLENAARGRRPRLFSSFGLFHLENDLIKTFYAKMFLNIIVKTLKTSRRRFGATLRHYQVKR